MRVIRVLFKYRRAHYGPLSIYPSEVGLDSHRFRRARFRILISGHLFNLGVAMMFLDN